MSKNTSRVMVDQFSKVFDYHAKWRHEDDEGKLFQNFNNLKCFLVSPESSSNQHIKLPTFPSQERYYNKRIALLFTDFLGCEELY